MVSYKGYSTGILYKAESAYGTPVTVDTAIQGKVTAFSANWGNNFFREQGLGEGRNATFTGFGPFDVGGTIEGFVGRWDFFAHLIGARSGSGTAASPYVLNEGSNVGFSGNDIASFTMQCGSNESTDSVDTYEGCLLTSATFTMTQGELLRFSAEWVAENVKTNTAIVSYSADTTALWNFAQGVLKWGATPSTVVKVQSASITISNNMFVYRALGSRFVQQPETGLRRYDFTVTVRADSTHLSTLDQGLFDQANEPHAALTSASPTASLELQLYFTGPTNQEAFIQLDEAAIETRSKPVDLGGGLIEVTYGGVAQKGLANAPIKWQVSA